MADFSQELQIEPDLTTQIFAPVTDTSEGEFIAAMGELSLDTDKRVATDVLKGRLEGEYNAEVERFKEINKNLQAGIAQSDPELTGSFRTRAEVLLREAIQRRPGLAQDFRAAAAQTIGFDPIGGELADLQDQYDALELGHKNAAELAIWHRKQYVNEVSQMAAKIGWDSAEVYRMEPRRLEQYAELVAAEVRKQGKVDAVMKDLDVRQALMREEKPEKIRQVGLHISALATRAYQRYLNEVGGMEQLLEKGDISAIKELRKTVENEMYREVEALEVAAGDVAKQIDAALGIFDILLDGVMGKEDLERMNNQTALWEQALARDYMREDMSNQEVARLTVIKNMGVRYDTPAMAALAEEISKSFTLESKQILGSVFTDAKVTPREANNMAKTILENRASGNNPMPKISQAQTGYELLKVAKASLDAATDPTARPMQTQQAIVLTDFLERTITSQMIAPIRQRDPQLEKARFGVLAAVPFLKLKSLDKDGATRIQAQVLQSVNDYAKEMVDEHRASFANNRNGARQVIFAPNAKAGTLFQPVNESAEAKNHAAYWNRQLGAEQYLAALETFAGKEGLNSLPDPVAMAARQAANYYGVPINMVKAVMKAESGSDMDSSKWVADADNGTAEGVMQIHKDNARAWGINAKDPIQNVVSGIRYLGEMLKMYKGDMALAVAAYHAGPGNMNDKLAGKEAPAFGKESYAYPEKVFKHMGEELDFREYLNSLSIK